MKKKLIYFALSILSFVLIYVVYFLSIKQLDKEIKEDASMLSSVKNDWKPNLILPALFIDGERFYFKLPLANNDTILAFGDTGGGISFLSPKVIGKGDINSNLKRGIAKAMMPLRYILFQDLVKDKNYPAPSFQPNFIIRNPFKAVTSPVMMIPTMNNDIKLMLDVQPEMEAFLGQSFFMGHSWTIDYPNEIIMVNTPIKDSSVHDAYVQKLGFKKNTKQVKIYGHPSMKVVIEGDTIDVLFDTGATIVLSEEGKRMLKTTKKTLGGSFIAASLYNKWRKEHPEWKYYSKADLAGDMIEVPTVTISGHKIGPVLFAVRKDEVWSSGMIASMDKVVKGAIGGSALKYFKVTIDYNAELVRFEK